MMTIPCAGFLGLARANRLRQLALKPARYFGLLFLLLLTMSLSACADPIRQDIKVQFVHAQTLKPLQGVFAAVEWMDVKTGICKRHSVLRSDAQGRVYFKKVPGAYSRPMNAMGLDLQTINREIDNKTGRPKHRMMNGRNPSEIPWEKMVLSLGYQKIDVQEHSSLYYDLWLPEDAITPLNGYVRSYMLSTRQTPFSASQYYTRIGGPCIYRQYDEKTGKNVESVDRSEYTEETRQALLRTKALAQYQQPCPMRYEPEFAT